MCAPNEQWEPWVYQAFYGLFVCPWYSYSQVMISEVRSASCWTLVA